MQFLNDLFLHITFLKDGTRYLWKREEDIGYGGWVMDDDEEEEEKEAEAEAATGQEERSGGCRASRPRRPPRR